MPFAFRHRLLMVSLWALSTAALAAPPEPIALRQFQRTTIDLADQGAGIVLGVVQDREGFLWITTLTGLYRFDGFEASEPLTRQLAPYDAVVSLLLAPDGSSDDVWLGHQRSGITHIHGGRVDHFDKGIPAGSVFALRRDSDGVVWAVTTSGIVRFVNGGWQPLPASMGYDPHPEDIAISKATGDVYVRDAKRRAVVLRKGGARFQDVSLDDYTHAALDLPAGTRFPLRPEDDGDKLLAKDGTLWYAGDVGFDRFRWTMSPRRGEPDARESMTEKEGLFNNVVMHFAEGREGEMWVASGTAIERFRTPYFLPSIQAGKTATGNLVPAADGSLWVASRSGTSWRYSHGHVEPIAGLDEGISAVWNENDGAMLVAGIGGLRRWDHGSVARVDVPGPLAHVGTRFRQLARDGDGVLWVIAATFGLYRVDHGHWERVSGHFGLPDDAPQTMVTMADGSLWLGYPDNRIAVLTAGRVRWLDPRDGLSVGTPLLMVPEANGAWILGTHGLQLWNGKRFRSLASANAGGFHDVMGLAYAPDGSLWIAHAAGVDRIDVAALHRFVSGTDDAMPSDHFDRSEGVGTRDLTQQQGMNSLRFFEGRLWLASAEGISTIDPAHLARNEARPIVSMVALSADGVSLPISRDATIPPLTTSLRIDYTAPMLRRPDHARFEYRLDGVDHDWQPAGIRRSAYYTNLAPGDYRFRVRAFNEDGVASGIEESSFRMSPAWYQTAALRMALLAAFLLAIWYGYRLRVRSLLVRARIRHDERERIARDLHDTLLQGFQGLTLRFQAVRRFIVGDEGREMIDIALQRADEVLAEGREKVTALREPVGAAGSLYEELESAGNDLSRLWHTPFESSSHGRARELEPRAHEEIVAMAREALINAYQHADAAQVSLRVDYGRRQLTVTVRDDGVGFDPNRTLVGHWGVKGIRERATVIAAEVRIESRPGTGTSVSIRHTFRSGR
ncbi:MAG: histidine kinase [Luteibacter sp.]